VVTFSSLRGSFALIKNNDEAIARWISHVISPHIVGVLVISALSLQYSHNLFTDSLWLLLLMPMLAIPPLTYLLWRVRRGTLEDIYMPDRKTRIIPLVIVMSWLLICLSLIHYLSAPLIIEILVMATMVLVGALSLVTLFWKISFHAATISAAATAVVLIGGTPVWPALCLIPIVGWSRVRLRRHTKRQVVFGSLAGMLVAIVVANGILINLG
jgi:membrane-associated phospholipid phosphatase